MPLDAFPLKEPFLLGVLSFQTFKDWSRFILCVCVFVIFSGFVFYFLQTIHALLHILNCFNNAMI